MKDADAPIEILLADDADAFASSLAVSLASSQGARVARVGASGEEIFAAALRLQPDVVLLDACLREGDPVEVTRRLRAALPETEVVVLALHPSRAYERRALAAGARALIGKAQLADLERVLDRLQPRKEMLEVPKLIGEEVTREVRRGQIGRIDSEEVERLQRLELAGVMAAGLAHDLASPIQTMKLELAALAQTINELDAVLGAEDAPPRARAAVTRARSTLLSLDEVSDYVHRMSRDFIRFARGGAPGSTTTEVRAAVDTAVRYTRSTIAPRASLALRVPRALTAAIAERTLARVMINLIVNACSAFTSGDPAKNWIVVTADAVAGAVRIEVTDNAGGIPPEARDHLFSPFAGAQRGRSTAGLGLGLAVARALLREVGGDLVLVATGADETRFLCTVPAAS